MDAPLNRGTLLDLYAATAEAISKWEPRFAVTAVRVGSSDEGSVELDLTGTYLPDGQEITLPGLVVS